VAEESSGQLFGKYELLEKIGAGGMAEIYRARSHGVEGFEKILCVKRILPAYAKNRAFIEMLIAEAKLSSLMQHGNVVQIYDLGAQGNQFYIVMEFVDGCDLLQLLTAAAKRKERFPTELALYVIGEVAKGLAYAHSATDRQGRSLNIIHRDVSPSNVLLSFEGDVKVVDFGVARADLESQEKEEKGSALKGKLGYMSPELVTGGDIDHRSDIFALGIILWETLTLRRLFLGKTDIQTLINIRDVKIDKKFAKHSYVPEGIQAIIRKALAKDVNDRYQTATDMHEAILDYLFENRVRVSSRKLSEFIKDRVPRRAPPPESKIDIRAIEAAEMAAAEAEAAAAPAPAPAAEPAPAPAPAPEPAPAPAPAPEPAPAPAPAPEPAPAPAPAAAAVDVGYEEDLDDPTPVDDEVAVRAAAAAAAAEAPAPAPAPASAPAPAPAAAAAAAPPALPEGFNYEAAIYKVRNDKGEVFGPITYHNFRSLVKSRGITFQEAISVNDTGWRRLGDLKMPGIDPRYLEEEPEQPLYEGPISRIRTPQLLYELAISRVIGKLKYVNGSTLKEVYFQAGVPVHINSNIKPELLANFMLDKNLIRPAQLNAALDMVKEKGGRLGDALVSLGLLKPHDLFRVVEFQFRQRFLQLFSWEYGWYEFLEGYPPPGDVVPINDGTVQLIAAGIRTQFDMAALRDVFNDYLDQVIVMQQNPHITHHNLRFNSRELRIFTYLETGHTLRDTLQQYGTTPEDQLSILQVVLTLHQTDLLSFRSPRGFGRATV